EREGMARPEREDEPLLGRRRLQLEIEALAELLAQREAPGAVHAAAEGRVQAELHAARFVEEAFQHHGVAGGQGAEGALRLAEVGGDLLRGPALESVLGLEPGDRARQLVR